MKRKFGPQSQVATPINRHGFTFGFIKKFWVIVKEDLMKAIRRFEDKGEISKGCNSTFLTLIPKVENPAYLGDFRPISLIKVFYKIVAKVLMGRLKVVG